MVEAIVQQAFRVRHPTNRVFRNTRFGDDLSGSDVRWMRRAIWVSSHLPIPAHALALNDWFRTAARRPDQCAIWTSRQTWARHGLSTRMPSAASAVRISRLIV
jgi:hypothetical protein